MRKSECIILYRTLSWSHLFTKWRVKWAWHICCCLFLTNVSLFSTLLPHGSCNFWSFSRLQSSHIHFIALLALPGLLTFFSYHQELVFLYDSKIQIVFSMSSVAMFLLKRVCLNETYSYQIFIDFVLFELFGTGDFLNSLFRSPTYTLTM